MFFDWYLWIDVAAFVIFILLVLLGSRAGASILGGLAAIFNAVIFGINPFLWAMSNMDKIAEFVAVYVFLGIIWSFINWTFVYVKSGEAKGRIETGYRLWKQNTDKPNFKESRYYPFNYRADSSMIATWVAFWPISIVWTFFSEIVVNIWNHIWNFLKWAGQSLSKLYAAIAEKEVDKYIEKMDNDPKN